MPDALQQVLDAITDVQVIAWTLLAFYVVASIFCVLRRHAGAGTFTGKSAGKRGKC